MQKSKYLRNPVLCLLLTAMILLDGMDLCARVRAPEELSHLVSIILPFTKISSFLFPQPLFGFANSHYMMEVPEPRASIVFFMLKISLVILAVLVSLILILFFNFEKTKRKFYDRIIKGGGLLKTSKNEIITLSALAGFCVYEYLIYDKSPDEFRIDITAKFFEDLICVILFCFLSGFSLVMFFYTGYAVSNMKRKN